MCSRWYWFIAGCLIHTLLGAQEKNSTNHQQFKVELDKLVQLPGMQGASIGWSFRVVQSGQEVEARHASLMLIPASTAKLYTSVAALEVLGPDFKFSTRLYQHGEIHRDRLQGDLVVVGSGDPSLGHRDQQVAVLFRDAVARAGIERIRGRVEADPHALPYDYSAIPRDRAWEDVANYYGGGVYGINWRNNSLRMRFSESGDSVQMQAMDSFEYPASILNKVIRGKAEEIYFFPGPFSAEIYAAGRLSRGEKETVERMALPNPPLQCVRELHDSLDRSGISVREGYTVRQQSFTSLPGDSLLAEYWSAPLAELLKEVNRNSNNLYAEAIARKTGMQLGSGGTAEDACQQIRSYLIRKALTRDTLYMLREGSGMGRKNLMSPSGMTDLLYNASSRPWFPVFEASLAIPGQAGTLRSFRAIPGLKAKTGSLSGIRAYAGYFTDASGQQIAFSIICNHYLDGSGIKSQVEQVLASASQCRF